MEELQFGKMRSGRFHPPKVEHRLTCYSEKIGIIMLQARGKMTNMFEIVLPGHGLISQKRKGFTGQYILD